MLITFFKKRGGKEVKSLSDYYDIHFVKLLFILTKFISILNKSHPQQGYNDL